MTPTVAKQGVPAGTVQKAKVAAFAATVAGIFKVALSVATYAQNRALATVASFLWQLRISRYLMAHISKHCSLPCLATPSHTQQYQATRLTTHEGPDTSGFQDSNPSGQAASAC